MGIELINNPGLEYHIITCPSVKRDVDLEKDNCCNTCLYSRRIYSIEDIPVGLFCQVKNKVVDWGYKCVNFKRNTLLPSNTQYQHY